MNKKVLGVAMVVVFCITWWSVAGEAWEARWQAKQKFEQTKQQFEQAKPEGPAKKQAVERAEMAAQQAADRKWEVAGQDNQRNKGSGGFDSGGAITKKQRYESSEYQQAEQAAKQAQEAKKIASAEWAIVSNGPENLKRFEATLTKANSKFLQQALWGIGAGALNDLLVLALILAGIQTWLKLTAKP